VLSESEDIEDEVVPPRPLKWAAFVGAMATFASNLGRSVTALGEDISAMMVHHVAYEWERDAAYQRTQLDIESLPVTEHCDEEA
jgi:hypothetical protein